MLGTLTPKHVHLPQPSISSSTWKRSGAWMCKLRAILVSQERLKIEVKLLLSAMSYMLRQLPQRMALSGLKWPFHTHRTLSLSYLFSNSECLTWESWVSLSMWWISCWLYSRSLPVGAAARDITGQEKHKVSGSIYAWPSRWWKALYYIWSLIIQCPECVIGRTTILLM